MMDNIDLMRPAPRSVPEHAQRDDLPSFISRQVTASRYLFLDLAPPPDVPLALACAGFEKCRLDYEINRSSFRFHTIEFIRTGRGEIELDGTRSVIQPGAVFAYTPATRHRIRSVGHEPLTKYFICLAGAGAPGRLFQAGLGDQARHLVPPHWLEQNFEQLLACSALSAAAARAQCLHLIELILQQIETNSPVQAVSLPGAFATFRRCHALISSRFTQFKSTAEIAAACNLDAAYLCRLFQRFAAQSPQQFLTRLKLEHAAMLLLRREANVKQAAAAVGYDDPYHFSRVFKQVHGMAPTRFIQRIELPHA